NGGVSGAVVYVPWNLPLKGTVRFERLCVTAASLDVRALVCAELDMGVGEASWLQATASARQKVIPTVLSVARMGDPPCDETASVVNRRPGSPSTMSYRLRAHN